MRPKCAQLTLHRHPYSEMGGKLFLWTILVLNVARFLNIFFVTLVVNQFRNSQTRINKRMQFVMWISGLRGAMAYALAMKSRLDFEVEGNIMLLLTLLYALITVGRKE